MKKMSLVLLTVVFLGGCDSLNTGTQYLAIKSAGIKGGPFLYAHGTISYSIQGSTVAAKVIWYQRKYGGLNPLHPGYVRFETEKTSPDLVRLNNCTVYDSNNWEGDLGYLHIKRINGKFVEPNSEIVSVSFWQWNSITEPKVYSSGHEWVEGTKHPEKHLVAAHERGRWRPEEGYAFVFDDKNEVKRDAGGWAMVKKIGEK